MFCRLEAAETARAARGRDAITEATFTRRDSQRATETRKSRRAQRRRRHQLISH